jgi:putative transcriptional regulator
MKKPAKEIGFNADELPRRIEDFAAGTEPAAERVVKLPPPIRAMPAREIRSIRTRLGLTQAEFAILLNVPEDTAIAWEDGSRKPCGAALRLLSVARKHPEALQAAWPRTLLDPPRSHVLALWAAFAPDTCGGIKNSFDFKLELAKNADARDEPVLLRVARATGHGAQFLKVLAEIEWKFALKLTFKSELCSGPAWEYLAERFAEHGLEKPEFTETRLREKLDVLGHGHWEHQWERDMLEALDWYRPIMPHSWAKKAHFGHKRSGTYRIPHFVLDLVVQLSVPDKSRRGSGRQTKALANWKQTREMWIFEKPEGIRRKPNKNAASSTPSHLLPEFMRPPKESPYGPYSPSASIQENAEIPVLHKPAKPSATKKSVRKK